MNGVSGMTELLLGYASGTMNSTPIAVHDLRPGFAR